jgi:hypothetical protein
MLYKTVFFQRPGYKQKYCLNLKWFLTPITINRENNTIGLWCFTLLSTIFQLYRGSQFYWWSNMLSSFYSFSYWCKCLLTEKRWKNTVLLHKPPTGGRSMKYFNRFYRLHFDTPLVHFSKPWFPFFFFLFS